MRCRALPEAYVRGTTVPAHPGIQSRSPGPLYQLDSMLTGASCTSRAVPASLASGPRPKSTPRWSEPAMPPPGAGVTGTASGVTAVVGAAAGGCVVAAVVVGGVTVVGGTPPDRSSRQRARSTRDEPSGRVTTAVTEGSPSTSAPASNGIAAVPPASAGPVPPRSNGAKRSMRWGALRCSTSSTWKRTSDTSDSGVTKAYSGPATVAPSRATGAERSGDGLTTSWTGATAALRVAPTAVQLRHTTVAKTRTAAARTRTRGERGDGKSAKARVDEGDTGETSK